MSGVSEHIYLLGDLPRRWASWRDRKNNHVVKLLLKPTETSEWKSFVARGPTFTDAERAVCNRAYWALSKEQPPAQQPCPEHEIFPQENHFERPYLPQQYTEHPPAARPYVPVPVANPMMPPARYQPHLERQMVPVGGMTPDMGVIGNDLAVGYFPSPMPPNPPSPPNPYSMIGAVPVPRYHQDAFPSWRSGSSHNTARYVPKSDDEEVLRALGPRTKRPTSTGPVKKSRKTASSRKTARYIPKSDGGKVLKALRPLTKRPTSTGPVKTIRKTTSSRKTARYIPNSDDEEVSKALRPLTKRSTSAGSVKTTRKATSGRKMARYIPNSDDEEVLSGLRPLTKRSASAGPVKTTRKTTSSHRKARYISNSDDEEVLKVLRPPAKRPTSIGTVKTIGKPARTTQPQRGGLAKRGRGKASEDRKVSRAIRGGRREDLRHSSRLRGVLESPVSTTPPFERLGSKETKVEALSTNAMALINELWQKGSVEVSPEYKFEHASPAMHTVNKWTCHLKLWVNPPDAKESVELRQTVSARSKKDAKKLCAKAALDKIVRLGITLPNELVTAEAEEGEDENVVPVQPDNRNLIGQLDYLYSRDLLVTKPKYTVSSNGGSMGTLQWKCTLLVRTRQYGEFTIEVSTTQKKKARNEAASKALSKLLELGMKEAEEGYFRRKETVAESDNESIWEFDDAELDEVIENAMSPEDLNGNFQLLPSFKVRIATSAAHCNSWIANCVQEGEALGIYIDSYDMRQSFKAMAQLASVDVNVEQYEAEECRAICFATASSALLVSSYMFESEDGSCWMPETVIRILETSSFIKSGLFMDEGAMVLYGLYGIECAGLNDLNMTAACVKGIRDNDGKVNYTAAELVREWLTVGFNPFCSKKSAWSKKSNIPREYLQPAVLTAAACLLVRRRINEGADEKHLKKFPKAQEYSELYNKLCTVPPLAPSAEGINSSELVSPAVSAAGA